MLLLWPVAYNGFPLVFADTNAYLASIYEFGTPLDRPPYYRLFASGVAHFTGTYGLAAAQAALAALVLYLMVKALAPSARPAQLLAIILLLGLVTSLPWEASWIMPDLFGGLAICCVLLLGPLNKTISGSERTFASALLVFGMIAHSGSLITCLAMIAFTVVGLLWRGCRDDRTAAIRLAALAFLAVTSSVLPNLQLTGRITINPTSNLFMLGRLAGDGLLQPYLKHQCPAEPTLVLCDQAKKLEGASENDFLWGDGFLDRQFDAAFKPEPYARLVRSVILYNLPAFIWTSARSSLTLLFAGSPLHQDTFARVNAADFSDDLDRGGLLGPPFTSSRQHTTGIALEWLGAVQIAVQLAAILALAGIVGLNNTGRRRSDPFVTISALVLLALLVNAAVHGVTSGAFVRYQAKVSWIPVLVALLYLFDLYNRTVRQSPVQQS